MELDCLGVIKNVQQVGLEYLTIIASINNDTVLEISNHTITEG